MEDAKRRTQQHRKRSKFVKHSHSDKVKRVKIEEEKSISKIFEFKRSNFDDPDMPSNNLLTVKSNSPGNDSLQLPTLKKSNERDRTLRKPHVDIMVGSFDDDLRRKPIRHSSDLDLEGEKKDNSKF